MQHFDFLIAGGGLAGCSIALELHKRKHKVMLADSFQNQSSSRIAAGLVNPIVPKGVKLTWKAQEIFSKIEPFYKQCAEIIGGSCYTPKPIYHLYPNQNEAAIWKLKLNDPIFQSFAIHHDQSPKDPWLKAPFGYAEIFQGGRLDVQKLMGLTHEFFKKRSQFTERLVKVEDIKNDNNYMHWAGYKFQRVIWAQGYLAFRHTLWEALPFKPNRGSILTAKIEGLSDEKIVKKRQWLVPAENANEFFVGSNFRNRAWRHHEEKDADEIIEGLKKVISLPFDVVKHCSGIRPAASDRRPYLGAFPQQPKHVIFNGMGSKGSSLVAYLAPMLADWLEEKEELNEEVDVCRVLTNEKAT